MDFNTIFDPKLDKQCGDLNCTNMYTDELIVCMEEHDLVDGALCTHDITISNDPEVILIEIVLPRLKVFDNILTMWHSRGLTIKGKVTILKSLALPKLLYPISVIPIPN